MILDACEIWHLLILAPVIFYTIVKEGDEFNGDNSFEQKLQELQFWWNLKIYTNRRPWIQWWQIFLWFLTPLNIETCQYWHLSSFRQGLQFCWNLKLYANRKPWSPWWQFFFVILDACQYLHLSSFRPQFWTKIAKFPNFHKILYFAQTEGGEFNGDNIFLWILTPFNISNC